MSAPYVYRRDISASEQIERTPFTNEITQTWWVAGLTGRLSHSGERVDMSRSGPTFPAALKELESAIAEQGWEIR